MPLTPVNPGTLTLDGQTPHSAQAGNELPYQVGVEFLGPTVGGDTGYVPILTPVDPSTVTGTPH